MAIDENLLTWMLKIERALADSILQGDLHLLDSAKAARERMALCDANCASLKDPPDAPPDALPKILTQEVVDEIELGAREDERRVIVANLVERARRLEESVVAREQFDDARYIRLIAGWIKENVV